MRLRLDLVCFVKQTTAHCLTKIWFPLYFNILANFKRASRVLFCFFMNTIFYYDDLVVISLNDKIIRYMFPAKNQMILFYFNYSEVL